MILKPPKGKLIIPGKPINRGLVGYWLMNEGGGNLVQDVSGNGNHGTITGATWVPGEFGPCLAMGGSGSVGAGDIEVLDGCSALTLSIWCMATTSAFPATGVLINKDDGASRGFYLRVATTEVVSATIYNSAGSSGAVTSSTDLFKNDVGTWRHIAVVWDGLTVTLYINGVPDGTPASLSGVMRSNAYSVGIGTNWPGSIDVPLIFNRALSPAEIALLARDPFVGSRREPIELWSSRPVYTGSGSPQVTKVTASGAGTFTAPIYAGAGSVTVSKATASGSGLFANAFYSGSGGGTVRPPVAAGTGTFTVPAYSGVGDVSVTKVTASGTGLFATAIYSGSGDVEVSKATAVGSGTFTVPTYECAGNVSIQKATVAGAGTFVVPTYEGYGSVSATKIVAAGSGLFATAIYNGSGDIAVSKVTVVGSGTFTVPTYSGSGSVSATKVTVVGSGLFAAEMYVGSISVTIARVEAVGVGTFAVPVYDGNGSVVVPQPAASGSGSFTAPVYSGLGVAVIRKATASGSGLHGLIFSGYGSVDTQRATASGAGTFFASGVSVASIFLLLKRKH